MRHLSACLNPSLRALKEQVDKLNKMDAQLQHLMPDMMHTVCFVVDYQKGCLTLGVTDAVWMTTLRYELPALRDRLRQEAGWHGLTSIQLKVQPGLYAIQKREALPMKPVVLTSVTQEALNTLRQIRVRIESGSSSNGVQM